jgi:hypothetical protein
LEKGGLKILKERACLFRIIMDTAEKTAAPDVYRIGVVRTSCKWAIPQELPDPQPVPAKNPIKKC